MMMGADDGMVEDLGAQLVGTGQLVSGPGADTLEARRRAADTPGAHIWIYMVAYRAPARPRDIESLVLDAESVLMMEGPGCLKCEQGYSNRLAKQPCRGSLDQLMPDDS